MDKNYSKLIESLKQIKTLESVSHILDWDQETMMPKDAAEFRAKQSSELSAIVHQKKTSKTFENILKKCINISTGEIISEKISKKDQINLIRIKEDYQKAKKLPAKFVKSFTEHKSLSCQIWAEARKQNNFNLFAPYLEKMVSFMRKEADYLGYKDHPYDALVDLYEPKMTVSILDPLFLELKSNLVPFAQTLFSKPKKQTTLLEQEIEVSKQLQFCRDLVKKIGLSESKSRLDTSSHPFCDTLGINDIRMTTSIKPKVFFNSIYSTLHECGHGLYEAGLPVEHFGTPMGEACSLGIHESQSRLLETFIGQSSPFIRFLSKEVSYLVKNSDHDDLYAALNTVEPSLIRIESDEVTYCLHILLRYELEKKLIEGSLKVRDLQEAWNSSMKAYLGITPPSDAQGCLQDIHWSSGLFGYFPTYALGNFYAAQIFKYMETNINNFHQDIASGNFTKIYTWLQNHIYKYGREKTPQDLIESAVGKKLSCYDYIEYLKGKYK